MKKWFLVFLTSGIMFIGVVLFTPKSYAWEWNDTQLEYNDNLYDLYSSAGDYAIDDISEYLYQSTFSYPVNVYNTDYVRYIVEDYGYDSNAWAEHVDTNIPYTIDSANYTLYMNMINLKFNNPTEIITKVNNGVWFKPYAGDLFGISLFMQYRDYQYMDWYVLGYNKSGEIVYNSGLFGGFTLTYGIAVKSFDKASYLDGYDTGKQDGEYLGFDKGYDEGLDVGFEEGKTVGYNKGISESVETGGLGLLLSSGFTAVGALLAIELIPNVSIGALVSIPIVFGVLMFILGRRKE